MPDAAIRPKVAHLDRGGTSVVVRTDGTTPPSIAYWGKSLGPVTAPQLDILDRALRPTLGDSVANTSLPGAVVPELARGWLGLPGIECDREGTAWAPRCSITDWQVDGCRLRVELRDEEYGLGEQLVLELEDSGLLRLQATVTNEAEAPLEVRALTLGVPVPTRADTLLDFAGGWSNERHAQRTAFQVGRWTRDARGGRPGLDGPLLLIAGTSALGHRSGEAWAVHLGWSGNQQIAAERTFTDVHRLLGGELLHPGEVLLGPGESYSSPWLYASWGRGLDEMAHRFHAHLRSHRGEQRPAPVLLNTWEATYFDQDPSHYRELAALAAGIGVELFVVDDGWFCGRDNDRSSLGDWFVDARTWPDGLRPFSDFVHELGMDFGLWVEPEMISLDSALARAHPEWVVDAGHGPGLALRHQHVLDLTEPDAYSWILGRLDALVSDLRVDYLKWDHNRPLLDAGSQVAGGRAVAHGQTLACYRLMADLTDAHPGLRIESCASGGGRIDLGILECAERVWPSDSNDAHDRLRIQRWTGLLLPPEMQGTHIGAEQAHATGRVADLAFRAQVAVWGNLGLELDLTKVSPGDLEAIAAWIDVHKRWRDRLHTGSTVWLDREDGSVMMGTVADDRTSALFLFTVAERGPTPPAPLRFAGLEPDRTYRVRIEGPVQRPVDLPQWACGDVSLPGRLLMAAGLAAPALGPDTGVLIALDAADA